MPLSDTVTVPRKLWLDLVDVWKNAVEARWAQAFDWWGSEKEEALWPQVFDLLKAEMARGEIRDPDPHVLVDNYLVNSEIVERDGFLVNGEWHFYYKKYDGSWERLCEDAIVHDDHYALMKY